MTKTIWRYPLPLLDRCVIGMPVTAQVISVGPFRQPAGYDVYFENPPLDLWAIVEPTTDVEDRVFFVVGTGNPIPVEAGRFIGTTHSHGGSLIWHVFEG